MRQWRAVAGNSDSFRLARHPSGFGTLPGRQVAEASQGRSLSLSRCGAGRCPLPGASIRNEVTLREGIEREAAEARRATPSLNDDAVAEALRAAADLVRSRS